MSEVFTLEFRARWADMDFNQHMRNSAYLAYSEEARMRYLDDHGWTMEEFAKRRLGPVVLEDRLVYKRELRLLEPFRVDLMLAAITPDGRRMKLRNHFYRAADGTLSAVVESVVLWLHLDTRKPVVPPPELKELWTSLVRAEDFLPLE